MTTNGKRQFLDRSRLRDVVLLCAFVSAPFCAAPDTILVSGFFVLALGCFLHLVAKGILIRNIVLCNRGLYGVVRHPYYLANYLIDWSFCILSGNFVLVLAYPFSFFWSYGPTMQKEEELLAAEYGDDFLKYVSEVPQVFPGRRSIRQVKRLLEGFSPQRVTWNECARLTRFCAAAILVAFVHDIFADGLGKASHYVVIHNAIDAVFFFTAIALYIASLALVALSKRKRSRR
jgi:Ergosterol biosynthesis ERG4/ERG24 family